MSTALEREIHEQPEVLTRLVQEPTLMATAKQLRRRDPDLIITLARGSSDHALTFFTYLAGRYLGLAVASLPPSVLTLYNAPLRVRGALAIGVSQSGESADVVSSLKDLGSAGATTLAITNQLESALARSAEFALDQQAGAERSVAASKTMTSQMMVLALLVAYWSEDAALLEALRSVSEQLNALLSKQAIVDEALQQLTRTERLYVLGRGLSYSAALESALKLKETSYLHAQAYSSAEFQHGPIAALSPGGSVLMLAASGVTLEVNREVALRLGDLGADLIAVTSDEVILERARAKVALPSGLHEVTEVFLQTVIGQLLALGLAEAKGLNPDAPRHLNKVTKTL